MRGARFVAAFLAVALFFAAPTLADAVLAADLARDSTFALSASMRSDGFVYPRPQASITAGQATGGKAELYVGATLLATDSSIAGGDATGTFDLGKATAVMYAADLTEAYVDYNKGDVTDPTTLGG